MAYTTLISPDELQEHLDDPEWRIFDCRYDMADPGAGATAFLQAHIPGACYAHLDNHLSALPGPGSGRHPLPDPEDFAIWLGRRGLRRGMQAVAYDDAGGMFAARLWFLLRWLGHHDVAVLDGGWSAWMDAGGSVEGATTEHPPEIFEAERDDGLVADSSEIERLVGAEQAGCVLDARAPERFAGEAEPIDPVAGHVPGAANRPMPENLDDQGRFRSPESLAADFRSRIGETPADDVIHMCGSGVSACQNMLAMEHAGLNGSRLYVGSWSEWIRDPDHPVAKGTG